MHIIDQALYVSITKNMILKVENNPGIGDQVANENLKDVEIVFDVFGPTAHLT